MNISMQPGDFNYKAVEPKQVKLTLNNKQQNNMLLS